MYGCPLIQQLPVSRIIASDGDAQGNIDDPGGKNSDHGGNTNEAMMDISITTTMLDER